MHTTSDIFKNTPLPWQEPIWKNLYQLAQKRKLPHGIFIRGAAQSGKTAFATAFAQLLLCESPQIIAATKVYRGCQQCHACYLLQAHTHPHYHVITLQSSDTKKEIISIETIRNLTDALAQTAWSHSSTTRYYHTIVLIDPADALHIAASNALLKTLEEPMPGIVFILLSAQSHRVPATIKSRCHSITLPSPSFKKGYLWALQKLKQNKIAFDEANLKMSLHITGYNPLQSLHLLQKNLLDSAYRKIFESFISLIDPAINPSDVAQLWSKQPADIVLNSLMQFTLWLIQAKLGNRELLDQLKIPKSHLTLVLQQKTVIALLNYLQSIQKLVAEFRTSNLNVLLCFEKLAYDFLYG